MLNSFFNSIFSSALDIISDIRILDIIDIAIVAFAIYKIIDFISRTRAQQLVNGSCSAYSSAGAFRYNESLHSPFRA